MTTSTQNVDPAELAKFEKLASRWWDPESEFKPLHAINPLRLKFINDRAGLKDKRVLDIGCGGGILTEAMAALGADVTGIDLGEAPLAVAKLHLKESGRKGRLPPRQRRGAGARTTGCVRRRHLPRNAGARARPGLERGRLRQPGEARWTGFFSTINRNPKSFLFAIVGAEYLLKLLPRGTHEYLKFIRPSELERMCRAAGLRTCANSPACTTTRSRAIIRSVRAWM